MEFDYVAHQTVESPFSVQSQETNTGEEFSSAMSHLTPEERAHIEEVMNKVNADSYSILYQLEAHIGSNKICLFIAMKQNKCSY